MCGASQYLPDLSGWKSLTHLELFLPRRNVSKLVATLLKLPKLVSLTWILTLLGPLEEENGPPQSGLNDWVATLLSLRTIPQLKIRIVAERAQEILNRLKETDQRVSHTYTF